MKSGRTPLYCCSDTGHTPVVELLLSYNADLTVKDKNGYTALHIASFRGNLAVVKALLKENIDVDDIDHVSIGLGMLKTSSL